MLVKNSADKLKSDPAGEPSDQQEAKIVNVARKEAVACHPSEKAKAGIMQVNDNFSLLQKSAYVASGRGLNEALPRVAPVEQDQRKLQENEEVLRRIRENEELILRKRKEMAIKMQREMLKDDREGGR